MVVDVSDLVSKKLLCKEIEVKFVGKKIIYDEEEIEFLSPIEIKGTFKVIDDFLLFSGTLKSVLSLQCSRCLEKFDYPIQIELHEKFAKNVNTNEDIIIINDDSIDFSQIIENNIILSLPIKKLCNENCKGLCMQCGTNLNYSTCNCENNNIDPRLEKLKDLLSSNQGGNYNGSSKK